MAADEILQAAIVKFTFKLLLAELFSVLSQFMSGY